MHTCRVRGQWHSAYTYGLRTPVQYLWEDARTREILMGLFRKYHLDIGTLEDAYEYNSYLPVGEVLVSAAEKWASDPQRIRETVSREAEVLLSAVPKY